MTKISAQIVADSICNGHRITTMLLVYPRFIHSEMCRHRMFSRNTASSRAIPPEKMIEAVINDPVIPIAWQKQHKGMQGTQYITDPGEILIEKEAWLDDRDAAVLSARKRLERGITKQIINRPLESWMWTVELVTATEWENFFHLRCPQYYFSPEEKVFRSRKDFTKYWKEESFGNDSVDHFTELEWLQCNKGQAEIHMMALAEAMWDARNESKPKELQPGEWHIPYGENFDLHTVKHGDEIGPVNLKMWLDSGGWNEKIAPYEVQLSTAVCARTSYTVVGNDQSEISPTNLLDLHNSLLVRPYTNRKGVVFGPDDPIHTSPSEHCAQAMTEEEFTWNVRGRVDGFSEREGDVGIHERYRIFDGQKTKLYDAEQFGWCHNLRGWKSYRSMIPNENRR